MRQTKRTSGTDIEDEQIEHVIKTIESNGGLEETSSKPIISNSVVPTQP